MGRRMRLTRRHLGVLAGVATLVGGGVAYGSIPDANKVFTGCMLNKLGTIRLIDKSLPDSNPMSHCLASLETEINWNRQGQPGPAGAPGPAGPAGPDGAPGKDGANGADGRDGKDGLSVTNAAEPPGANCAGGGSQFTVGAGPPTFACNGKDGMNGSDGKDGANGTNGQDGVSVTSVREPAGPNCANGGSRFTSASGVTYACNGANGANGSAGPVVADRVGHATLADGGSTPIFAGGAGTITPFCLGVSPGQVFTLFDTLGSASITAFAVDSDLLQTTIPNAPGDSSSMTTTGAGSHRFSALLQLSNGYSIEYRGVATVDLGSQTCSIVYNLTVSKS